MFLPSYSLLKKCVEDWAVSDQTSPSVLHRLELSKNKVIVEPTGSQEAFEDAREEYNQSIRLHGNCVLLAVYRGKMSEGVSFNDDFARAVICVGLPLPNFVDRAITAKRAYNDEQRVLRKRTDLLPGDEWYKQQAYRALAQALGRCIRHSTDYGTVVLMDSRHCHDNFMHLGDGGVCQAHKNLPKWMRLHVRNLSRNKHQCMNVQVRAGCMLAPFFFFADYALFCLVMKIGDHISVLFCVDELADRCVSFFYSWWMAWAQGRNVSFFPRGCCLLH